MGPCFRSLLAGAFSTICCMHSPPYPVRVALEYVSCAWECGDCPEAGRVSGLAPLAYGGAAHTARTGHTVTEEVTRRKVITRGEASERLPPRREPVEAGSLG